MTECDCKTRPVVSSREREPGARHVHVTDERGTWCAVAIGLTGPVYRQALVSPSPEELQREVATPKVTEPLATLARAVLDGALTDEDRATLTKLAGRETTTR